MNEATQSQVVERLKRELCKQQNCLSKHQDNIELIVFDSETVERIGLMCSACFLDTQLIQKLLPVEKYVLPIRKYMSLIVSFYQKYLAIKESGQWGPVVVQKEGEAVRRKIELFYNDGLKSVLQIGQFAESIARKATESLRKVYQDADFDKIVQYLNEQNQIEQERIMVSTQLTNICSKIRLSEGKLKYATQQPMRRQAEEIIGWYRQQIAIAIGTLKDLVEVHRQCLKSVVG